MMSVGRGRSVATYVAGYKRGRSVATYVAGYKRGRSVATYVAITNVAAPSGYICAGSLSP